MLNLGVHKIGAGSESTNTPLLGDDIRSHLGATTLHMALIDLFRSRGVDIANTYQLNFGGNTDFLNMSGADRATSKQKSKRVALSGAGIDSEEVAAGPNGFVKYLGDTKVCYLRLEGRSVLGSPISMEVRLQVEDSPNSAGAIVNAVRIAQCARDDARGGIIEEVCPFLFKSPSTPMSEQDAALALARFIDRAVSSSSNQNNANGECARWNNSGPSPIASAASDM